MYGINEEHRCHKSSTIRNKKRTEIIIIYIIILLFVNNVWVFSPSGASRAGSVVRTTS